MWKFMKLGISPEDLYNCILKGLIFNEESEQQSRFK